MIFPSPSRFFFLLLLTFCCFADDKIPEFETSLNLDKQENHFLKSTSYKITPKVDPVSGNYSEEEIDLVVAGGDPLSLRRFYNHSAPSEPRYGNWRYNPESYVVGNFEWDKQPKFAAIGFEDGRIVHLDGYEQNQYFFQGIPCASDGKTHPLNLKINFRRNYCDPHAHNRFTWDGEMIDGSGARRLFTTSVHKWLDNIYFTKKTTYSKSKYRATPNVWTPFQLRVSEERKPNGNIITYAWEGWKDEEHYPFVRLLSDIAIYNHDKSKKLASFHFYYRRNKAHEITDFEVLGSDGRKIKIEQPNSPTLLSRVISPEKNVSYHYKQGKLEKIERPDGRVLITHYQNDKVSAQYAPVGPKGKMYPIGRYEYFDKLTKVTDANGDTTTYYFDEHKRITGIEKGLRIEEFTWNNEGDLVCRKLGPFRTDYTYDENHNCIEEKSGKHHIIRTYSKDGFNLKLSESDRPNKTIRYSYIANTNLLSSELVYEDECIRKRLFHFYDDCALCIKTIEDDGSSTKPNDLTNVTFRHIIYIKPKQSLPCFGLPEVIEEKTIDNSGKEILLKKTTYCYSPSGNILQEVHYDSMNRQRFSYQYMYNSKNDLIETIDPLNIHTSFAYDDNHNLLSLSGPKQHKTWVYDKANRPTRETNGSLIFETQYDKLGQVIARVDEYGCVTRYAYDIHGNLTTLFYPDGSIERKEYDLYGNLIKEIDPNGYTTLREYNDSFQPIAVYYPDGRKEHFTYYPTGSLATCTNNEIVTTYEYDIFDNVIREEVSANGKILKVSLTSYSPFNKLSATDPEGVITTYFYDFAGRKIAEEKGGSTTFFTYDELGRKKTCQEGQTSTTFTYDNKNRLIQKQNSLCHESYAYDAADNLIKLTTTNGTLETTYDDFHQPLSKINGLGERRAWNYLYKDGLTIAETNPKGTETIYKYDAVGNLVETFKKDTEIIQHCQRKYDLNGNCIEETYRLLSGTNFLKNITHRFVYGPCNHLEKNVEAGQKETKYFYHNGRLTWTIKPDGTELKREYDPLGRLIHYLSNTYTYDKNDRLLSVSDGTKRVYDALGNIIHETLANGLTLSHTYERNNRIKTHLPDGSTFYYSYLCDQLASIEWKNLTTFYERDGEGNIIQIHTPCGEFSIERDPLDRWKQCHSEHYSSALTYDPNGNLIEHIYTDPLGTKISHFTYDLLDQLTSENENIYTYDSLFNRLGTQPVNDLCQITDHYLYDPNGNLISDGTSLFTYDAQDRLITMTQGDHLLVYTYDTFHRRLSKTLFENGEEISKILYLWDGDNEIGSFESGKIKDLRILGEGLGAEIGAAAFIQLNDQIYIPIHDHRGNCVVLLDPKTKESVETYRYAAFGEELTTGTFSPWRFASKRYDLETGFVYFGRRYYSPILGRWITPDPEGFDDGPNLYAYLHNCPLNDFDLYGLWSWASMWEGARSFGWGAGKHLCDMGYGAAYSMGKAGEWMHADFQYEYFNDSSFFKTKSISAAEGWSRLGRAAYNDPLGTIAPGLMEACRMPSDAPFSAKAEAWGKGAVDICLAGLTLWKGGQMASTVRKFNAAHGGGPLGKGVATFGNVQTASAERMLWPTPSITGFTEHAMQRAIQRGVSQQAIFDALSNPLKMLEVKFDQLGRPSQRFIGRTAK